MGRLELRGHWNYLGLRMVTEVTTGRWGGRAGEERMSQWTLSSKLSREEGKIKLGSRGAPGKSGLHASGEGERVIAPEPW